MAALLEQVARDLDRLRDDVGDLEGLLSQRDLPARDLRDVEQIVDEPDEMTDLSLDDLLLAVGRAVAAPLQSSSAVTIGDSGFRSS